MLRESGADGGRAVSGAAGDGGVARAREGEPIVFRVSRKTLRARVHVESSCAAPRDARALQASLNLAPETIEATAY